MEVPVLPFIDRGDPDNMPDDESGDIAASGSVTPPRVGGVDDGVPWVGGSFIDKSTEPQDVLCYRPTTFKEKQRQCSDLKKGVEENQKLDFVGGNQTTVWLTMWITWVTMMLEQKGMDTVFKILVDSDNNELCLLESWGMVTMSRLRSGWKFCKAILGTSLTRRT